MLIRLLDSSPDRRRRSIRSSKQAFLTILAALAAAATLAPARAASADTFHVGPSREHADLRDVLPLLQPGDTVEVDGDAEYEGDLEIKTPAAPGAPITIRGVPVRGRRPILRGGENTVTFLADHYAFEGFEITGGAHVCLLVAADDLQVRDVVIHDCPRHGVLAADQGSGSQTYAYVEIYACGEGETRHQMYLATDETAHPGAVVRVEHCYLHDATGGNNLKSRAERNEIYYNWIEGAAVHEIDLIGPDGQDEDLAREDSDVVGNVLVKRSDWYVARLGGDGTGQTWGRYRLANNTIVVQPTTKRAIYLQDGIESLELTNNVFYEPGDEPVGFLRFDGAAWSQGVPLIAGRRNWIHTAFEDVPAWIAGTLRGREPGFVDADALDLRLRAASPLVNRGSPTAALFTFGVPSPLPAPAFLPPPRRIAAASARLPVGAIDIGSFEYGSPELGFGGSGDGGGRGDATTSLDLFDQVAGRGCGATGTIGDGGGLALVGIAIAAVGRRPPRRRRNQR